MSDLLLAGIGWASLGFDAADEMADELARRVGVERGAMRDAVQDTVASWRSELDRLVTPHAGRTWTPSRFASHSSSTGCGCSSATAPVDLPH